MKSPLFTYKEIERCIGKLEDILDGKPIHEVVLKIYEKLVVGETKTIQQKLKEENYEYWLKQGVKETIEIPLERHIELYEDALLEFEQNNK